MLKPLSAFIDHTLLKPDATAEDIENLCVETLQYQFASACVHPYWVEYARKLLPGAKLGSVVGFPLGLNTTETKSAETQQLVSLGVDEVDMVINVGALKSKDYLRVIKMYIL